MNIFLSFYKCKIKTSREGITIKVCYGPKSIVNSVPNSTHINLLFVLPYASVLLYVFLHVATMCRLPNLTRKGVSDFLFLHTLICLLVILNVQHLLNESFYEKASFLSICIADIGPSLCTIIMFCGWQEKRGY